MINKFKKSKRTNTLLGIILIISVGLIGLTGCKLSTSKSTTTLSNPSSDTKNPETNSQSNTNKPAQSNTNTTNKPAEDTQASVNQIKEVFYGEWVIKQVLAYGPVGTYSNEDAKSLLGKTLSFSADKASYFGDQPSDITKVAANPVYKKSVISNSDFITNYRISLDKLGIKADSISEIMASDSKGYVCTFIIKDNNTLIIYGGGTYFELVRKTV